MFVVVCNKYDIAKWFVWSAWRQVLLVTASRNQELWIVPGGGIEPTEDPRVAALREVQEEAGAKGSLGRCLGVFEVRLTALRL